MSKDICQVMDVLIIKVWAVVPEGFLLCLSYQMGVLAEDLLTPSHQHFVKRNLNWGAPWELPWTWPHQEARYPSDLVIDAVA